MWDRAKSSCKANAAAYIERVARRFGLEDTRTHETPMEAGFEITESDFVEKQTGNDHDVQIIDREHRVCSSDCEI